MQTRWAKLCRTLSMGDSAEDVFGVIESMYSKPPRAYHSMEHVGACLDLLDRHLALAQEPSVVELALWFHDAIYDATRSDNEKRSAEVAGRILEGLGLKASTVEQICVLIEATEHVLGMNDIVGDIALMLDIDLSILGSGRVSYSNYASAIRTEYAFVDDAAYAKGRSGFLSTMLDRTRIFRTDSFFDQFEMIARENMVWENHQLGAS